MDSLTTRRRQNAEKLAEDALVEAKKQEEEKRLAEAQLAAQQNGMRMSQSSPAIAQSVPTKPTAIREGEFISLTLYM